MIDDGRAGDGQVRAAEGLRNYWSLWNLWSARQTEGVGRSISLRVQLLLLQALIVVATVAGTGVLVGALQERLLRDAYLDRMTAVAQSVARLPVILDAYRSADPSPVIQPVAEVIREASNVTYVVVTDEQGIRYSHPKPARIGEPVSTDPSVPLSGEIFVGTETGTLGESWRVKVPVFSEDGAIIGAVSVGILESALREEYAGSLTPLLAALGGAAVLGVLGAAGVTAIIRRRIYRLEPKQIASLVDANEIMLHGLSEGVVAVDGAGLITVANDAARELLGTGDRELVGRPAAEVLEPGLRAILDDGEREGRLVLVGERIVVARSTGRQRDDGRAVDATLLVRDHTELHDAVRQMEGAQSLTDGLRAQAHEFQNTMHVVGGLLELGLPQDALAVVRREGRGGSLGTDAADALQDEPELAALLMVKRIQARERGMSLEVDVAPRPGGPDGLRTGLIGEGDLVTIVGNLVDNAMEVGGVGTRIALLIAWTDDRVTITVEDDGPGVPPELRRRVFDVGVTTKDAPGSEVQGSRRGIGLALVRRIAERHRGSVSVDDSPGLGGARFVVDLPAVRLAPEEAVR